MASHWLLKLCGLFQTLVGIFCCIVFLNLWPTADFVIGILFGTMGLWLCALGLGVMASSPWACSLSQATAWLCFAFGAWQVFGEKLIRTARMTHTADNGDVWVGQVCGLMAFAILVRLLLFVLIPLGLALAYSFLQPIANAGEQGPGRRWSRDHPTSALVLSGLYAVSALILGCNAWLGTPFLFFGVMLPGPIGAQLASLVALGMLLLSVAHGLQWKRTWLFSSIFSVVIGGSIMTTLTRVDSAALYTAMEWSAAPGYPHIDVARYGAAFWMFGILGLNMYGLMKPLLFRPAEPDSPLAAT
ncbi:MAG: hypothetical protein KF886_13500 [Candidatus Hydrogenedentes bacterium]|nr:hypothetical protein [Candidatus Hydrogenedentota bacterium]